MKFSTKRVAYDSGTKGVEITLNIAIGYNNYDVKFGIQCASEMERDFLFAAVRDQFQKHITRIRKAAYEAGWRDKTKRNKKQTWFNWCADAINPFN